VRSNRLGLETEAVAGTFDLPTELTLAAHISVGDKL
jgi:hypothetical protein